MVTNWWDGIIFHQTLSIILIDYSFDESLSNMSLLAYKIALGALRFKVNFFQKYLEYCHVFI